MTVPKATITEDLTAQVNGFTATYVVSRPFIVGTLCVELNGQRLRAGSGHDFVETSTSTFELNLVPEIGEHLLVQFEVDDSGAQFPVVIAYPFDPTGL